MSWTLYYVGFLIGLDAEEESQNITEMLRSKVREKLKNAKVMLFSFQFLNLVFKCNMYQINFSSLKKNQNSQTLRNLGFYPF